MQVLVPSHLFVSSSLSISVLVLGAVAMTSRVMQEKQTSTHTVIAKALHRTSPVGRKYSTLSDKLMKIKSWQNALTTVEGTLPEDDVLNTARGARRRLRLDLYLGIFAYHLTCYLTSFVTISVSVSPCCGFLHFIKVVPCFPCKWSRATAEDPAKTRGSPV